MATASNGPILMEITIHWTGGKQKLEISDANVALNELKRRIEEITNIPIQQQRLVSEGRVINLDSDEITIIDLIKNGALITVAKAPLKAPEVSAEAQAAVLAQPVPPPNPLGLAPEMMPLMQPMLDRMAQNPELLSSIMSADPRMQRLMEQNPELRQMIQSPSFLRQMGETFRNPAAMQEMMRSTDRQLANIENIPGGFQALSTLYSQMTRDEARETNPSTDSVNEQFAERLGATDRAQPLPNPWVPRNSSNVSLGGTVGTNAGLSTLMGMGNPLATMRVDSLNSNNSSSSSATTDPFAQLLQAYSGGAEGGNPIHFMTPFANPYWMNVIPENSHTTSNDTSPSFPYNSVNLPPSSPTRIIASNASSNRTTTPSFSTIEESRARYQSELETLNSMGFTNEAVNIRALRIAGGNVQAAIEFLLGQS